MQHRSIYNKVSLFLKQNLLYRVVSWSCLFSHNYSVKSDFPRIWSWSLVQQNSRFSQDFFILLLAGEQHCNPKEREEILKSWFSHIKQIQTKAMRLPEIFDFRQFPIAESQKFLKVETSPVYLPWFRMSENFAKLTENFPENRNIRNMSKLSKMIGIFGIFGLFRIFRKSGRPSHTFCQNTYIPKTHSKPS